MQMVFCKLNFHCPSTYGIINQERMLSIWQFIFSLQLLCCTVHVCICLMPFKIVAEYTV